MSLKQSQEVSKSTSIESDFDDIDALEQEDYEEDEDEEFVEDEDEEVEDDE